MALSLIEVRKLVCHERVDKEKVDKLVEELRAKKILKKPVVVDRKTMVILDGHHRCKAFACLGIKKIPCLLVDYFDDSVELYFRRLEVRNRLMKEVVLSYALSGKLFPMKTTKHRIKNRFIINYKLNI